MQPLHVRRAAPVDIRNGSRIDRLASAIDFAIGHPSSISNARLTAEHVIVRYLGWKGRISRAAVEREILSPRIISALTGDANIRIEVDADTGASKFHEPWGDLTYVGNNMTVITVYRRRHLL